MTLFDTGLIQSALGKNVPIITSNVSNAVLSFFERLQNSQGLLTTRPQLFERRIIYPLDTAIGFPNNYPLDSDLSVGQRYPAFEQPGPGEQRLKISLYKSWENLAADQSFGRNLMKGGSELTKLRHSCSWKQVHSKKIQNSYHISPQTASLRKQTFLLANRPQPRGARRNGCFRRLPKGVKLRQ